MPTLTWPSKSVPVPDPARWLEESLVFPGGSGSVTDARQNHLLLGDNLPIMQALMGEYEGKLDLIYADPPFFTNRHFPTRIGRQEDSRHPEAWKLAPGYGDSWKELDAYLDFLYPRLLWMYRLLSPRGTLYLHLDWHADAPARLLLDEIFGRENFINEIVWAYHGPSPIRRAFNRKHDVILMAAKSSEYIFNPDAVREPYHPNTVKTFQSSRKAGFGKQPDLARGKVPEDWWYMPVVARLHNERSGYPTQKPEALAERILLASSLPESLVADLFCGSGTFPVVAARHGRRFIACDATWRAVHTTSVRLITEDQPFLIRRDSAAEIPHIPADRAAVISGTEVRIPADPEIDYWEVDPAWDGVLFQSRAQACRHKRTGEISYTLSLAEPPKRLRVRAVTLHGQVMEF